MRRTTGRAAAALAAVLVPLLSLTGCDSLPGIGDAFPTTSTPTMEEVPAEFAPYYHQTLSWEACGEAMQCTTAIAPLDWADPAGERIDLAVVRKPATGARIGSLLINPGGPGGSGYDWVKDYAVRAASSRVMERYDLIGFDPRGVGRSTAVSCADSDAERDAHFFGIVPGTPGSPDWLAATRAEQAAWQAACAERSGGLLGHVDTGSAARDMDMLRAALGEVRLDYLGYSYGTYLGARYAELFPHLVGRFVLDGAMDPTLDGTALTVGQARGFEQAFHRWLESCLGQQDCPFRGDVEAAVERVQRIFHAVEASPLRHDDGRELGTAALFTAIIVPLYDPATWGFLTQLFTELEQGEASTAFLLIDSLYGRDANGVYTLNQSEAQLAVNCLDIPFDASDEGMAAEAELLAEEAPLFGPFMAWGGIACEFWRFPVVGERHPIVAEGAADIVVIGTTGDPATPYEWAVSMAEAFEGGHLISYEGEGHTAYNRGASSCIDDAVDAWLIEGKLPADGLTC